MKKFFFATLVALAGLAVASCDLLNPDEGGEQTGETKAPVLSAIQGAVLDAKGADITTTYTAADFGQKVTINYALFVDKAGNKMAKKSEVKASIADGKITIKQSELSLAIMALGVEVGEEVEVELALYAYVGSTITSAALVSNYVKATFTTCAATIDDDTLAKIEVVGDFDGWGSEGAANMGAYLYKYGEEEVYSGLVYYAAKCVNGWKLRIPTAEGGWDDNANWGIDENELATITAQANELYASNITHPEITELTLACAGSSKDMKIFNHNFYFWTFNKETALLKVDMHDTWETQNQPMAFDYMYLAGDFNSWTEFQEAAKMKYIPTKHTFYLDVTFEAEKSFKFLADGQAAHKWYLQWGIADADGKAIYRGENIPTPGTGNYRVYFDFNHMVYSFDSAAYGTTEEGGVDVAERALDKPDEYYIHGNILGKTWDDGHIKALNRNSETGVYSYTGLPYKVGDMFKIVKNDGAAWLGVGQMEPYTGTRNTLTGTDNFEFERESGFDITVDPATGKVTIADSAIPGWGIKGNIIVDGKDDGWSSTFAMTQEGDIWTSDELQFAYDGTSTWGFKLCLYGNWDAGDVGVAEGTTPTAGTAMPAVDKLATGSNSNINYNGKAVVKFDAKNMTITIIAK